MHAIFTAHTIWSFRKELQFVAFAFLVLISLPIIAVIILTHTGVNIVSDALIDVNPESQTIQIKNPADGTVVKEVSKEEQEKLREELKEVLNQLTYQQLAEDSAGVVENSNKIMQQIPAAVFVG